MNNTATWNKQQLISEVKFLPEVSLFASTSASLHLKTWNLLKQNAPASFDATFVVKAPWLMLLSTMTQSVSWRKSVVWKASMSCIDHKILLSLFYWLKSQEISTLLILINSYAISSLKNQTTDQISSQALRRPSPLGKEVDGQRIPLWAQINQAFSRIKLQARDKSFCP